MIRRLPVIPTLIVLVAVGIMVRLGFWQLDRLHQKEAMLALYARNAAMSSVVPLPQDKAARAALLFRHTALTCRADAPTRPMAGRTRDGQAGWSHWGECRDTGGKMLASVNLGISQRPEPVRYTGGPVTGFIAEDDAAGARVVADQPLPGLAAAAAPDPADVPNNHLSYAVQWFLFALTALVIYALAVRKRLAGPGPG